MQSSNKGKVQWFMPAVGILVSSLIFGTWVLAQEQASPAPARKPWVAPASERDVKNPIPINPKTLAAGEALFKANCVPCHGDKGNGEGEAGKTLNPRPADFTDAKLMSLETDGTLFWKMSKGRAPMPSWEDDLKEEERWELVNYIRQLSKNAGQK